MRSYWNAYDCWQKVFVDRLVGNEDSGFLVTKYVSVIAKSTFFFFFLLFLVASFDFIAVVVWKKM